MSDRFVTDPARLRVLLAEKFKPWPLAQFEGGESTGHRGTGFVRDSRFGGGQVIPGTNRATSRKWRNLAMKTAGEK